MLTIESRGFWLVWSLLLAVLLGEGMLGFTMREMAGTWVVFMIGCVYIIAACLRAGLWSRRIKNAAGTNVLFSLVGSAVIGVFTFVRMSAFDVPLPIHLACAAIAAGFTFALTLAALLLCGAAYNKRHEELEKEADKEE